MPSKRPKTFSRLPLPGQQESNLAQLDIKLAKSLASDGIRGDLDALYGQTLMGLRSQLEGGLMQLTPEQEAQLQQYGQNQLGQLLGSAVSRGLEASSITGGSIGGLAAGLTSMRPQFAMQNLQALSSLSDNALRNRLMIQQSLRSPLERLTNLRMSQAVNYGPKSGGLGGALGSIAGGALGFAIGGPIGAGLGSSFGGAVAGGGGGGVSMPISMPISFGGGKSTGGGATSQLWGSAGTDLPGSYVRR